ncbi:MAG: hypothetical protein ACK53Y_06350, partial [bacterium]
TLSLAVYSIHMYWTYISFACCFTPAFQNAYSPFSSISQISFILETCRIIYDFPGTKVRIPPSCISPLSSQNFQELLSTCCSPPVMTANMATTLANIRS